MKEYVLFIGCLHYLSVHCHSCYFYIQHHGGIRVIASMPIKILFYITFYIINTMKKHLSYQAITYSKFKTEARMQCVEWAQNFIFLQSVFLTFNIVLIFEFEHRFTSWQSYSSHEYFVKVIKKWELTFNI